MAGGARTREGRGSLALRRAAAVAVAALAPAGCGLDASSKNRCETVADCRPGSACVAETCVPFDPAGAVWAPPSTYSRGIRRNVCNADRAAFVAEDAMRRAGFPPAAYVDPNLQFTVAVNQGTIVVVAINAIAPNDFWFNVLTASETDGTNARMWRDTIAAEVPLVDIAACDGTSAIATGLNEPATEGRPRINTVWVSLATPTRCGGFIWCSRVAQMAMLSSGLTARPVIQSPGLVVGAGGDSSVSVDCVDLGTTAAAMVFAASMDTAADTWSATIATAIGGAQCP